MIDTELKFCENDLNEIIRLFDDGKDLPVRHLYSRKEDRVVNTIVVGGRSYAYGNLVGTFSDEIVEKRIIKRYAKLSLYKALSTHFNKTMPWGALTGIRPTKLAYQQLEESGEFLDFFINTMKVSREKATLIQSVLDNQKGIYSTDGASTDLFVFIPFCPTRCKYCSFISADLKSAKPYVNQYVDALIKEIEDGAKYVKNLRSIYVGGGTPVSLDNENLEKVLRCIDKINTGVEFTVEAGRPDVITKENLALLKKYRVTRICVNPQTFNDKTLTLLGRNHTGEQVIRAYELCKDDFSVNMDLIAGLEGESFEDFKKSIDTAISLSPDNVTVHTLCIKKGSALAKDNVRLDDGDVEKMVNYARESLVNAGYGPYYLYRQKYMAGNFENVGYSKKGKECVYNIDVMEETTSVVACGANAISKRVMGERIERYASPKDVKTYIEKLPVILQSKGLLFK